MTAFVVAPSAVAARMMEQLLRRAGFTEVRSFQTGAAALEALRDTSESKSSPDLLVTEWELSPNVCGLDLVREFKAQAAPSAEGSDAGAACAALIVSTRNTVDDIRQAVDAGADAYLLKPLDPDLFVEKATALSDSGSRAEAA